MHCHLPPCSSWPTNHSTPHLNTHAHPCHCATYPAVPLLCSPLPCLPRNLLQFCEGVSPGQASARDCLEDHMYEAGFSDACREKVEALVEERSGGGGRWLAA